MLLPIAMGLPAAVMAQVLPPFTAGPGMNLTIPTGSTVQSASSAVYAFGGGKISGDSITVLSTAPANVDWRSYTRAAVRASGVGSVVTLTGNTVINARSTGVVMDDGGVVYIPGSTTINISGDENASAGILVNASGAIPASATGSGIVVDISMPAPGPRASNNAWNGVEVGDRLGTSSSASTSSSAFFDNLTVRGSDVNVGVHIVNRSSVTLTNSNIAVNGTLGGNGTSINFGTSNGGVVNNATGFGVYAAGSNATLVNTNITTGGFGEVIGIASLETSVGVLSGPLTTSNVTMTGGSLTVNSQLIAGGAASAIQVGVLDVATLTNVPILVSSAGYFGITSRGSSSGNGIFTGNSSPLTMLGANSIALNLRGGTINLTDSTVMASGANSIGVGNSTSLPGGRLSMSGGSLSSTSTSIQVQAADSRYVFSNGVVVTNGNGILMDVAAAGVGTLLASDESLSGDVQAVATNSAFVTLTRSSLTGNARNAASLLVDADSVWMMNDNSDTGTLNNAGVVGFAVGNAPGKTVTAHPTYAASSGQLLLNTYLGTDGSPSDKLVITGMPTGTTEITITNVGGPGAQTTGNGILVVDTQVGSANNAFTLAGGSIQAGSYIYTLHQAADNKWYLQSSLVPVLSFSKTANVSLLTPGGTIIYTVAVSNAVGATTASNVVVSDPLPVGITAMTWTCTGTCPNASGSGALNETIPALAAGASATYTLTATVSASPPASVVNTAAATSPGSTCADSTPAPCSSSAVVPPVPVVNVSKTADAQQAVAGANITYTLVVANISAVSASGIVISDTLAAGLSSYMWTCTATGGALCPQASGMGALSETIATLPGDASLTYRIIAAVSQTPPASITNTASVVVPGGGLCVPGNTASPCVGTITVPSLTPVAAPIPVLPLPWLAGLMLALAGIGAGCRRRQLLLQSPGRRERL